jgi:hypothetical protein
MQNKKLEIRKMVSQLNNDEAEGGGFWLPNIQRPFVWSEDQIARLFDSIMREYPISTLLVWKTKENVKHRQFIGLYHNDIRLSDFNEPPSSRTKSMVLDGQQRLQSLFIGLRGSYNSLELCFDLLSGDLVAPEDIRYRFVFKYVAGITWPFVRFKDIINEKVKLDLELVDHYLQQAPSTLTDIEKKRVERNIGRARREFVNESNLTYQELDGVDNPEAYQVDDIVEIFIRANSGGTKLSKSDLLFSLLTSSWDNAGREIEALLDDLNEGGFEFEQDFVLKCCLTVLDKGARYEVGKFRDGNTKNEIVMQWERIANAIKAVRDFLVSRTYIRSDKAMPSYQALIPLIYLRYHFADRFTSDKGIQEYLLRALVTGVFSGNPDNLIDKIVRVIKAQQDFNLTDVYEVIRADGRNLEITSPMLLSQLYGSRTIHLLFNLWYKDFSYSPALDSNGPQVDHIFPQSLLKTVKVVNPDNSRLSMLRYRSEKRDQFANLMLLTAEENGFSGKTDTAPSKWFARSRFDSDQAHADYLKLHLIPDDPALWELERFEDFVIAREKLIAEKFSFMLRQLEVVNA